MVLTTASGLLFFYFSLTEMAVDAITAVADAVLTTVSGLYAFSSYAEAVELIHSDSAAADATTAVAVDAA